MVRILDFNHRHGVDYFCEIINLLLLECSTELEQFYFKYYR